MSDYSSAPYDRATTLRLKAEEDDEAYEAYEGDEDYTPLANVTNHERCSG